MRAQLKLQDMLPATFRVALLCTPGGVHAQARAPRLRGARFRHLYTAEVEGRNR